ncbi:MAG: hypothetical protein IKM25_03875 [Clostridia bacterium]|nr:hypothetical protein [Clostridia bacterium]
MAKCPKCGRKLTLFDWRPNCPGCGVNLVYYGLEDKLLDEADAAEAEHAKLQKRIDRLKASFVGSKLTVARIVLSLLPVVALLIPLCSVKFTNIPFKGEIGGSVNLITLINVFSGLDFDGLFAMFGNATLSGVFIGYAGALLTLALSLVFVLVSLFALVAACGPKGNIRNIILNSIAIVFSVASLIFFSVFSSNATKVFPEMFTGKIGVGIFVYIAALIALLVLNIVIAKKGTPVKYKPCFVGGIPADEYFELVEKGTSKEEIRKIMNDALDAIEAKKAAEKEAKEAVAAK